MMEALQPIPAHVATRGRYSPDFFTPEGRLRCGARRLQPMPLDWVLHERYQLPAEEVSGSGGGWAVREGGEGGEDESRAWHATTPPALPCEGAPSRLQQAC